MGVLLTHIHTSLLDAGGAERIGANRFESAAQEGPFQMWLKTGILASAEVFMKRTAGWLCAVALLLFAVSVRPKTILAQAAPAADISGTWVGTVPGPQGQMEVSYKLNVSGGKITGIQTLPFRDFRIVDGQINGDSFHFVVVLDRFGKMENREVTGKIVGDTVILTPALPGPPPPDTAGPPCSSRRSC